ncbi:MAG: AAA-like domain-containing protein, partial [Marinifilaceae bacterium]|nr:AAA-like domain-containing protein [Marinifilaceae bacterium]
MKRKRFNIAGNCIESENYMIPTKQRIREVYDLVEEGSYFTIYSSRQSGKTTAVKDLVNSINNKKEHYAIYCSLEKCQNIEDTSSGIIAIYNSIKHSLKYSRLFDYSEFINLDDTDHNNLIESKLLDLCFSLDKKLVLIFDEADCLEYNVLISFLRQIRSGYINRDQFPFVYSIGLVGMRKLKDYKADIRPNSDSAGTSSPFNIAAGHYTLANFTLSQIAELYN